jgi:Uma2 family endonuclease
MAHPTRIHAYTYQDYLALEAASNVKHEYLDGEIYGMAGGTPAHAALAVAVSSALHQQLRGGPCRVYSSDLRVRALASGLTTYPDVTVICGDPEIDPESATTVTNPRLVIEVLSDSTEAYDRGEKLDHYRAIASIAAVVLVSHRAPRIEAWLREGDGEAAWRHVVAAPGDTVQLPGLAAELDVAAVYDGIDLAQESSPPT